MAPGEQDPFLQVQEDVQSQLASARSLFSSYLRIRSLQQSSSSTTDTSPELASAKADLISALEDLKEDVTDLADAVRAAERDPSSFGLDGVEVSRRKRLVVGAAAEIEDMMEEMERAGTAPSASVSSSKDPFGPDKTRTKGQNTSRGSNSLPDPSSFAVDDDDRGAVARGGGDYAAEFEHQTQEQLMREQDEALDEVYVTVGNLRNMADDMGRELHEQTEMLEHTDRMADRVGERLQTGMDKMKHIIRKNEDGLSSCCIAVLITVLIILLVLLLIL